MDRLTTCITRIRDWMASNRLKLNEDKTQIIWLGTRQQLEKVTMQTLRLPEATVSFSAAVNDLGVLLDSRLTMADHITALTRSCFFPPATENFTTDVYVHKEELIKFWEVIRLRIQQFFKDSSTLRDSWHCYTIWLISPEMVIRF